MDADGSGAIDAGELGAAFKVSRSSGATVHGRFHSGTLGVLRMGSRGKILIQSLRLHHCQTHFVYMS
jgi:hypothetical protein